MPVSWVLCDDSKHKGERFSFEECLACAKNRGPRRCHNAYEVINAIALNAEERRDAGMSTTMLTNVCPRRVILEQEHEYGEHPSGVYARVRGTSTHLLFEHYGGGLEPLIAEVRFRKRVLVRTPQGDAWVWVTGKTDKCLIEDWDGKDQGLLPNLDACSGFIIDNKSSGDIDGDFKASKHGKPQDDHVEQVNIYAWLLWGGEAMQDYDPAKLLGVRLNKGQTVHVKITGGGVQYMDNNLQRKIAVPIWPIEETEALIVERLTPHVHYQQTGELPPILTNVWGDRHAFCKNCVVREFCDARS